MSGEETEESVSVTLPGELTDWLDGQAGEDGDREAVLRDLVRAVRTASGDGTGPDAEHPDPRVIEERLDSQRQEYRSLVEDVRERVIQVKREVDAKAHADHAHPDVESAVDDVSGRVADVEEHLEEVRRSVEDLEAELESGFENYEDVLTYLADTTEEVDEHLDVLARAVVDVRERLHDIAAAEAARQGADELKLAANREGVTEADCEECSTRVAIALLTRPECPHCGSTFADVRPARGFFGTNRLLTGTPPALEGDVGPADDRLAEMVEDAEDGSPSGARSSDARGDRQ